ncbi:MAG: 2-hydroxyhepta-2,4-diene-1,7-dioate isomerase [Chloroflexi bacterium]|nr:MAG: 2-hydroxyhepta-2,4-diene-1,7-dioate isomerase [Chloroflexota bacterium]
MRIVRFIESWLAEVSDEDATPRWGMLVDDLVYPLARAPYLPRPWHESVDAPKIDGDALALDEVILLPPVTPSKIVCVGRNYAEHAAELGNEVPPEPLIFLKPPSSLVGPNEPVVYPGISARVDHEAELAVVIGQRCRNLDEAGASAVIYGYTIANDVTARDLQRSDGQWTRGKGFDTFCPVGPWIDTTFDPANRQVRCLVNGEVRQDGNTALLIYSLGRVLAHVTRFMTLEAGDLLLTGTPAGVGPVEPGDEMTVEIEGLGSLSNPVISEEEEQARRAERAKRAEPDGDDMPF